MRCLICKNKKISKLTNRLRNGRRKAVFYCGRCELGFLKPNKIDVKRYYDKEYRKTHTNNLEKPNSKPDQIYESEKKFQNQRLALIKKFLNKKKTFLEIGCSAGQFIAQIKNFFGSCEGVDLDSDCAAYVNKKFGIKVQDQELKNCDFGDRKFDYVAAFQTLEHVVDPMDFLLDIKRILKPQGKVFIEVPNLRDALLSLWPVKAYRQFYFHEAHLFYFTPRSLKKLFSLAGFKIEKMHFLQDYNFFNHFFWFFNNGPQSSSSFGLSEPKIYFSDFSPAAAREINKLIKTTDKEYKKVLARNQITSNIFIVASPKNS